MYLLKASRDTRNLSQSYISSFPQTNSVFICLYFYLYFKIFFYIFLLTFLVAGRASKQTKIFEANEPMDGLLSHPFLSSSPLSLPSFLLLSPLSSFSPSALPSPPPSSLSSPSSPPYTPKHPSLAPDWCGSVT